MTKLNQTFTIHQGESRTITVTVTDATGAAVNLTGATLIWLMWRTVTDDSVELSKTPTLVNVNGTNDGIEITLDPDDTKSLIPRTYYHECRVTIGSTQAVVFTGHMTVVASTTRPS